MTHGIGSVGHFKSWWTLSAFGQNWDAEGFCIAHKGTVFDSHLLSLYGQIVLAAVLYVAASKSSATGRTELAVVSGHAESVLSHGFGHGFIYLIADERGGLSREQPLVTAATPLLIAGRRTTLDLSFLLLEPLAAHQLPAVATRRSGDRRRVRHPHHAPHHHGFWHHWGGNLWQSPSRSVVSRARQRRSTDSSNLAKSLDLSPLCGKKDRFYALYGAFQSVSMISDVGRAIALRLLPRALWRPCIFRLLDSAGLSRLPRSRVVLAAPRETGEGRVVRVGGASCPKTRNPRACLGECTRATCGAGRWCR